MFLKFTPHHKYHFSNSKMIVIVRILGILYVVSACIQTGTHYIKKVKISNGDKWIGFCVVVAVDNVVKFLVTMLQQLNKQML